MLPLQTADQTLILYRSNMHFPTRFHWDANLRKTTEDSHNSTPVCRLGVVYFLSKLELPSHALPNCSRSPVTERPRFHCPAGQRTVTGTETWKVSSAQLPWVLRYPHVCVHINNVPSEPAAKLRSKWKHSWRWFTNLRVHIAKSLY